MYKPERWDLNEIRTQAVDSKILFLQRAVDGHKQLKITLGVLVSWCDKIIFLADEVEKRQHLLDYIQKELERLDCDV